MRGSVPSAWTGAALICGKCSRKVGGGFGKGGAVPLAKALRRYLGLGKGRRARAGVAEVKCLGLCPKGAVVAIDAARPGTWRLIRPGAPLDEVARDLGLAEVARDLGLEAPQA